MSLRKWNGPVSKVPEKGLTQAAYFHKSVVSFIEDLNNYDVTQKFWATKNTEFVSGFVSCMVYSLHIDVTNLSLSIQEPTTEA